MDKIDFKKLRKDLLSKVGPSGIMPLIISVERADEEELVRMAKEYNLDITDYMI